MHRQSRPYDHRYLRLSRDRNTQSRVLIYYCIPLITRTNFLPYPSQILLLDTESRAFFSYRSPQLIYASLEHISRKLVPTRDYRKLGECLDS